MSRKKRKERVHQTKSRMRILEFKVHVKAVQMMSFWLRLGYCYKILFRREFK